MLFRTQHHSSVHLLHFLCRWYNRLSIGTLKAVPSICNGASPWPNPYHRTTNSIQQVYHIPQQFRIHLGLKVTYPSAIYLWHIANSHSKVGGVMTVKSPVASSPPGSPASRTRTKSKGCGSFTLNRKVFYNRELLIPRVSIYLSCW